MINVSQKKNRGFTLLIAIITTSVLFLVSFIVANIALKQLILAYSNQESQYAFYAADSGVECAYYWDTHGAGGVSAFATSSSGSVTCNGQTVTTGSQTVGTSPTQPSQVGGGGSSNPTSVFSITLPKGCVIVFVTKYNNGNTTIDSRGYNTCVASSIRRFERGITTTY